MQISVQIVVRTEVDEQASVTEIAHFEREGFDAGSLGLDLDEAKALLGRLQRSMIDAQAAEAMAQMSVCPECGSRLTVKGHHRLVYRCVFGRLSIDSPRLYQCRCSGSGRRSVSPLASCLRERTSPELQRSSIRQLSRDSKGQAGRYGRQHASRRQLLVAPKRKETRAKCVFAPQSRQTIASGGSASLSARIAL
jgi:ribosomal protein L37AE/L43A